MIASKEPTKPANGFACNEEKEEVVRFKPEKLGTDYTFKRKIVWFNAIGFLFMHIAAVYGTYLMFTSAHRYTNYWCIFVMFLASEGITIGAHRLYSHKSFKATFLLKLILVVLQTVAGQNCMYIWVRDHRQHHKFSDTDADPHNANRGFFFSHVGWLMSRKHPLVITKGKTIDMSDLESDKLVMFQKKYYKTLYLIFAMAIPILVPVYFWNETYLNAISVCYFVRYVIQLNATWLVNSWAHLYGTRPYNKSILPVETYFVGFVAIGEGWHNYHHTFPWDYKASELGAPFNVTRMVIEFLAFLGLAYDLRSATDVMIERRCRRTGDGSCPTYGLLKKRPNFKNTSRERSVKITHRNGKLASEGETLKNGQAASKKAAGEIEFETELAIQNKFTRPVAAQG